LRHRLSLQNVQRKAKVKVLATGLIGMIVAVAGLVCLMSSMCSVAGDFSSRDRMSFAALAIVALAIAVGGVMWIGKINRKT
jgi:divalent metal cation (Fe/Co/Zn/Cd) transporter